MTCGVTIPVHAAAVFVIPRSVAACVADRSNELTVTHAHANAAQPKAVIMVNTTRGRLHPKNPDRMKNTLGKSSPHDTNILRTVVVDSLPGARSQSVNRPVVNSMIPAARNGSDARNPFLVMLKPSTSK